MWKLLVRQHQGNFQCVSFPFPFPFPLPLPFPFPLCLAFPLHIFFGHLLLRLLEAIHLEVFLGERVAICFSSLVVWGHVAAPFMLDLTLLARAFWVHDALYACFLASLAWLPFPISSDSIEKVVTYPNGIHSC